jgi:hypothetical protein
MQSLSEYTNLSMTCLDHLLRSIDLENNHENLEKQEDNPFYYFLQIIYLFSNTRCDLSFSNRQYACFSIDPHVPDTMALNCMGRYLLGTQYRNHCSFCQISISPFLCQR